MTRPIHVVGITQRSGTNFLTELLDRHPHTVRPRRIAEDHLQKGAGPIVTGVREIVDHYPSAWIDGAAARSELEARIGAAMLEWLRDDAGIGADDREARLLTKSPGARYLDAWVRLATAVDLVLLVRDGRDVVASGMAGKGWSFRGGVDRWVHGAREILGVVGRPLPLGARVWLVRYEDLVEDLEGSLLPLLDWLDLDRSSYDLAAARSMPVYGSSFERGGRDELHWDPVEAPDGFDPRGRAAGWPQSWHDRFATRAAVPMRALGYELELPSRPAVVRAVATEIAGRVLRRLRG